MIGNKIMYKPWRKLLKLLALSNDEFHASLGNILL